MLDKRHFVSNKYAINERKEYNEYAAHMKRAVNKLPVSDSTGISTGFTYPVYYTVLYELRVKISDFKSLILLKTYRRKLP